MRVAFVYANPRERLARAVARGEAPDTGLLGQNHLASPDFDSWIYEPRLRRRAHSSRILHRLTWTGREATLPWELRAADAVCTPLGAILPLAARLRRGRPRVVVLNVSFCAALDRLDGFRRRTLARSLREAPAIVCFSEAQRRRLLRQTDVDPARVHTALLGVDDRFYSPAYAAGDGTILAVGRDLARDYATFVDAVRRLGRPATIVASARNLHGVDLPSNVDVRIDVSPAEMRELYERAGCVVIPTRSEDALLGADCSGQTVLLDAMAAGKVAIATRRATLEEYVDEGRTAFTVPASDPAALADAIDAAAGDARLQKGVGTAARRRVEARHTTRHFACRLTAIIRSTMRDDR